MVVAEGAGAGWIREEVVAGLNASANRGQDVAGHAGVEVVVNQNAFAGIGGSVPRNVRDVVVGNDISTRRCAVTRVAVNSDPFEILDDIILNRQVGNIRNAGQIGIYRTGDIGRITNACTRVHNYTAG